MVVHNDGRFIKFNTIYTMFACGRHRQDDGKRIAVLLLDQTEGGLFCHTVL